MCVALQVGAKISPCLFISAFNPQTLLNDPLYIGVPQKRVTGKPYDDLIDEFITAANKR